MANYTILLIDYEPRSIERFREPLVAAGYLVEIANDGLSGIEAFNRLSPDMVLVEAMIPKKHGFEVCQELKRTPHGQKTPIIITTGVYKGRKYRTQALHIYGCDEYIEKPIAPQQLLGVVGKFFESAPTRPTGAAELAPGLPMLGREPSREPRGAADPKSSTISAPRSVSNDDAEGEIMARLDAIIPTGSNSPVAVIQETALSIVAPTKQDPFAQMRAELDAELDALPSGLPFGSDFASDAIPPQLPSDQALSASVLEALPIPEAPPQAPDTKRSGGKKQKSKSDRRRQDQVAPPAPAFKQAIPRGTIVESAIEPQPMRRGIPKWIFAIVGVVAIAAVWFFVFANDGPKTTGAGSPPVGTKPSARVSSAVETHPTPAVPTPVVTAPVATPPLAAAPPASRPQAPESRKVVRARSNRTPVPVRASAATMPSIAPTNSSKPDASEAAAAKTETVPIPAAPVPAAPVPAAPAAAAPTAAAPTVPAPLIPIDQADTMPVPLSHRYPTFSAQAKQLGLSGTVVMNVLVNDRGAVDQVVLVTGVDGADVNDAAMAVAKSWSYRPATKSGVPVKVWKSERIAVAP